MERKSKQRDGILEILSQMNYHPNAEEIYFRMKETFPSLGVATVYRNLEQLSSAGKIVKIDYPGEPARYDGNVENHSHIRCRECGLVEDVWLNYELEKNINFKEIIPDFKVTGYRIDFLGICKKCKDIK